MEKKRRLSEEYLNEIRARKIEMLADQQPVIIIAHLVAALLFMYVSWRVVPRFELLMFVLAVFLFAAIRLYYQHRYQQGPRHVYDAPQWGLRFSLMSLASGLLWGISAFFFIDAAHPLHLIYVVMIYLALAGSSLGALSSFLPAYLLFSIPLIGLLAIKLIFFSSHELVLLGILSLIFLAVNLYFGYKLSWSHRQLLLLGYENIELVDILKVQRDLAERANRAKSRFLAAASHDLRQPLHAMGLYLSVLAEKVRGSENRSLVQKVVQSMQALEGLLNALLDISKLDAGIVEVHARPVALGPLMQKVADALGPEAREKGLDLLVHKHEKCVIETDPILFERILRNFVSNAIRHTERGRILMGCRWRRDGRVCIEVRDTGPGIPPAERAQIFEEFYQIDNPERDRRKGLGLGLAIARRMANLLGHDIEVRSEPERGSVFAVCARRSTRPLAEATEGAGEKRAVKKLSKVFKNDCQVIVIDDEIEIRDATKTLLERWGAQVLTGESPEEVLAQVDGERLCLLITDYRLREGKRGTEVVARLRDQLGRGDLPAIVVSGDTSERVLKEVQAAGLVLLHKPINPAQLRMTITRLTR